MQGCFPRGAVYVYVCYHFTLHLSFRKLMNGPVATASGDICMLRSKLTLISGNTITTVTTNLPYNAATDLYVILQ